MSNLLVWPQELRPSTMSFGLNSNGAIFTSPFTGGSQTVGFPGSHWTCELSFENKNDDESRTLEALLWSLDGYKGRILIWDFGRVGQPPKGSPYVNGDGQGGVFLNTLGWTANTLVLRKGDYISVNNELKMVTENVSSGSDGSAVIPIAPQWRDAPENRTPIVTERASGVFRLADPKNTLNREPAFNNQFSISFVEHIYAV